MRSGRPSGVKYSGALVRDEAHRAQDAVAAQQLGGQDRAVAAEAALQELLLDRQPEGVALLQLGVEVHVPLEDRGQVHGQQGLFARVLDGPEQAGVDDARDRLHARLVGAREHLRFEAAAVAAHLERAQLVDAVAERGQYAVGPDREPEGLPDGQAGEVVDWPRRHDQVMDARAPDGLAEKALQRRVACDRARQLGERLRLHPLHRRGRQVQNECAREEYDAQRDGQLSETSHPRRSLPGMMPRDRHDKLAEVYAQAQSCQWVVVIIVMRITPGRDGRPRRLPSRRFVGKYSRQRRVTRAAVSASPATRWGSRA